jgi:hypothetical protein
MQFDEEFVLLSDPRLIKDFYLLIFSHFSNLRSFLELTYKHTYGTSKAKETNKSDVGI